MIDFHSHILPGLDDGLVSMEETLEIAREARKAGFEKIIATTHYSNRYVADEKERTKLLNKINKEVDDIELVLGSEIYINHHVDDLIKENKASTINKSKYILFEMPLREGYPDLKNVIIDLISKGYYLIFAHPERYSDFQEDPRLLEEFIDLGVYLQANYLSILGFYGKDAQKTVELLFKHDMISFLGTDVHEPGTYYPKIKTAKEKIISLIGEERFEELSDLNPREVLKNNQIETAYYQPITKNMFGKYK